MNDPVFIGQTCILNLVAEWFFKTERLFLGNLVGIGHNGVYPDVVGNTITKKMYGS